MRSLRKAVADLESGATMARSEAAGYARQVCGTQASTQACTHAFKILPAQRTYFCTSGLWPIGGCASLIPLHSHAPLHLSNNLAPLQCEALGREVAALREAKARSDRELRAQVCLCVLSHVQAMHASLLLPCCMDLVACWVQCIRVQPLVALSSWLRPEAVSTTVLQITAARTERDQEVKAMAARLEAALGACGRR